MVDADYSPFSVEELKLFKRLIAEYVSKFHPPEAPSILLTEWKYRLKEIDVEIQGRLEEKDSKIT